MNDRNSTVNHHQNYVRSRSYDLPSDIGVRRHRDLPHRRRWMSFNFSFRKAQKSELAVKGSKQQHETKTVVKNAVSPIPFTRWPRDRLEGVVTPNASHLVDGLSFCRMAISRKPNNIDLKLLHTKVRIN